MMFCHLSAIDPVLVIEGVFLINVTGLNDGLFLLPHLRHLCLGEAPDEVRAVVCVNIVQILCMDF